MKLILGQIADKVERARIRAHTFMPTEQQKLLTNELFGIETELRNMAIHLVNLEQYMAHDMECLTDADGSNCNCGLTSAIRALDLGTPEPEGGLRDVNRCAVCGWPLKERLEDGCIRGNCSMRPFPKVWYDPDRAKEEGYRVAAPSAPAAASRHATKDCPCLCHFQPASGIHTKDPKVSHCRECDASAAARERCRCDCHKVGGLIMGTNCECGHSAAEQPGDEMLKAPGRTANFVNAEEMNELVQPIKPERTEGNEKAALSRVRCIICKKVDNLHKPDGSLSEPVEHQFLSEWEAQQASVGPAAPTEELRRLAEECAERQWPADQWQDWAGSTFMSSIRKLFLGKTVDAVLDALGQQSAREVSGREKP